jgi:hypothetical protein
MPIDDNFLINDDNGEQQDEDWILSWESQYLMEQIKKLPTVDDVVYNWDQHVYPRHRTSCTKFNFYNERCSIFNRPWSREEIDDVEEMSKTMWRLGTGHWRSSSQWADAVRLVMWKTTKRQVNVEEWSEAWETLIEKNRPIGISVVVDKYYWREARKWGIKTSKFARLWGHSTFLKRKVGEEDMYEIVDSVEKMRYDIPKDVFFEMVENWNIRNYAYVLFPKNILDMPELDVLPEHIKVEDVDDFDDKQIIVARQTEWAEWINGWNELLYKDYTKKNAVTRMLIDLARIREGFFE